MLIAQLCLTLCDPTDCSLPWNSPGRNIGVGCFPFFGGSFQARENIPPNGRNYLICRSTEAPTYWSLRINDVNPVTSPSANQRIVHELIPCPEMQNALLKSTGEFKLFEHWSEVKVAQPGPTLITPWTAPCQTPWPMGFSRQEYRSGLPFLSTRDLPKPGIEPGSPALQADSLPPKPPKRFWALAVPNSLLGTLQPMLHFLSLQPGVWRLALLPQASRPKLGLVTAEKR